MAAAEITLKNGAKAPGGAVKAIMINLGELERDDPPGFCELVCISRDPAYQIWGDYTRILRERGLLGGDGQPHDIVRDVVLSAATGDDPLYSLGSPYA
ncbi:MAG TPA: hypothetical protein VMK84_12350 [Streptosporangiaceae bacterium]|nr:hypothetical protein [Streptosporangiaceae bacterium]